MASRQWQWQRCPFSLKNVSESHEFLVKARNLGSLGCKKRFSLVKLNFPSANKHSHTPLSISRSMCHIATDSRASNDGLLCFPSKLYYNAYFYNVCVLKSTGLYAKKAIVSPFAASSITYHTVGNLPTNSLGSNGSFHVSRVLLYHIKNMGSMCKSVFCPTILGSASFGLGSALSSRSMVYSLDNDINYVSAMPGDARHALGFQFYRAAKSEAFDFISNSVNELVTCSAISGLGSAILLKHGHNVPDVTSLGFHTNSTSHSMDNAHWVARLSIPVLSLL